jgi:hypothetical protein
MYLARSRRPAGRHDAMVSDLRDHGWRELHADDQRRPGTSLSIVERAGRTGLALTSEETGWSVFWDGP